MEGQQFNFSSIQSLPQFKEVQDQLARRHSELIKEERNATIAKMMGINPRWDTMLESHDWFLNDGLETHHDYGFFYFYDNDGDSDRLYLMYEPEKTYINVEIYGDNISSFAARVDEFGDVDVVPDKTDKNFKGWASIGEALAFALFFLHNLLYPSDNNNEEKEPEQKKNKTQ